MDNPEDATKLLSWTLAGIAMDEPAPAIGSGGINEMVFDLGLTRLRQPGMKWYGMKLATNNPDEQHWTYRKFVNPGNPGFKYYQPTTPENIHNLPEGYYEKVRMALAHRPDLVRRFIAKGADLLVNISNDGYSGRSAARNPHLKLVRMRAAENARWILRDTNNGVTAVIDPAGRIAAELPSYKQISARVRFSYETRMTFYAQYGDWFAWSCLILSAIALLLPRFKKI